MASSYVQHDLLSATEDVGMQKFALALRHSRLEQGLSLRTVAKRIGLSAHSGVAEYESGRRIPPEDLIDAYERALCVPEGYLQELRKQALKERANRVTEAGLSPAPLTQPAFGDMGNSNLVRIAIALALTTTTTLVVVGVVLTARVLRSVNREKPVALLVLRLERGLD